MFNPSALIKVIGLTSSWICASALAGDLRMPEWHGYISQGAIHSTDHNVFGQSDDDISLDFGSVTLGSYWQITDRIDLSIQGINRRAGRTSENGVQLDYGFISSEIFTNSKNEVQIRAGRVKNPIGLYNETRDVPSARPSILLPQSTYFDRLYTLYHSSDGVNLTWKRYLGTNVLTTSVNVGKPVLSQVSENALFFEVPNTHIANDRVQFGKIQYESPLSGTTLAFTRFRMTGDVDSNILAPDGSDLTINSYYLSAQKSFEKSEFTTEYGRISLDRTDTIGPFANYSPEGEFYYLQYVYNFTPNFSVLSRYDAFFNSKDDRSGRRQAALLNNQNLNFYSRDVTLGARYIANNKWVLSLEHHRVKGYIWTSFVDNPSPRNTTRRWGLTALEVSYQF